MCWIKFCKILLHCLLIIFFSQSIESIQLNSFKSIRWQWKAYLTSHQNTSLCFSLFHFIIVHLYTCAFVCMYTYTTESVYKIQLKCGQNAYRYWQSCSHWVIWRWKWWKWFIVSRKMKERNGDKRFTWQSQVNICTYGKDTKNMWTKTCTLDCNG